LLQKAEMEALKIRVKKHKVDIEKLKSEIEKLKGEIDKLKGDMLFVKSSYDMKKFAYYICEFNEDFFNFSQIQDIDAFFKSLDKERKDLKNSKGLQYLNMNVLIDELAVQPYHKQIIKFYESYGLTSNDFFILMKIRIQHNNYDFNSLPNVETDFMNTLQSDIQKLKHNEHFNPAFSVFKSSLEHLLNGLLKIRKI